LAPSSLLQRQPPASFFPWERWHPCRLFLDFLRLLSRREKILQGRFRLLRGITAEQFFEGGLFLGETMLGVFFLLSGLSMLEEARFPKWLGWSGVGFSVLFLVGAFRNVTSAVQVIADINNGLLPLWMVVMGTALIWYSRRPNVTPVYL
jgi:hypothetical protein